MLVSLAQRAAVLFCPLQGVRDGLKASLSYAQMRQLARLMGLTADGKRKVILLRQFDLDMVFVPPGWWHWVDNLQVCVGGMMCVAGCISIMFLGLG